jgi:stearoyl-CoA desaturase (delta-9 desaturase)
MLRTLKKNIAENKVDWTNLLFISLNLTITLSLLTVASFFIDFSVWTFVFALIFSGLTNLSITAGYHRHFSHKSYEAHPIAQFFFLFFGASAYQGSALKWSSDHRIHHRFEDTDKDPYSITKGFWHAHILWLFDKDYVGKAISAPDLEKNKMVKHQHEHYLLWSIGAGYVFPLFVASLWNDPIGGLLIAGGLRIFLTQQSTFFVNSICHIFGNKTYNLNISARDSWWVAFLTHGEGYHNFHHTFQFDYRNGIRWYQWDPTKWMIVSLSWLGLAKKLKTVPDFEILKARLAAQMESKKNKVNFDFNLDEMREKILKYHQRMNELKIAIDNLKLDYENKKEEWMTKGENFKISYQEKMLQLKKDFEVAKIEFEYSLKTWKYATVYG